jgi:hypothetical protein
LELVVKLLCYSWPRLLLELLKMTLLIRTVGPWV